MKPAHIRLEFAPGARPGPVAGRYLLVAGVALLAVELAPIGLALVTREHDHRAFETLLAQATAAEQTRPAPTKPDPADATKLRAIRQVSSNLAAPWADLLAALEAAPQQSVALMAVEPSSNRKVFRLTAEARDAKSMLDYLDALRSDGRLDNVTLISHQYQMQAPGKPIRFQLQAGWEPTR